MELLNNLHYLIPQVAILVGISGLIIGRLFFRSIGLKTRYLWNYLIMGWAFLLIFFMSSALIYGFSSFTLRWIETGIIYALYIMFIALGNHRFRG